jgi:hypothetical protein
MVCIICGKKIEVDENEFHKDSGVVFVDFGFGSKYDGDSFTGNIHDNCFKSIQKNFSSAGETFEERFGE